MRRATFQLIHHAARLSNKSTAAFIRESSVKAALQITGGDQRQLDRLVSDGRGLRSREGS